MKDLYPPFLNVDSCTDQNRFFEVARVFNKCPRSDVRLIVSTSLYFGIDEKHPVEPTMAVLRLPLMRRQKRGRTWWDRYFLPFLHGCTQQLPAGWHQRLYLAANLRFLIPHIPAHVEVVLMKSSSRQSVPGMFWRYLPAEEDVLCVARGADNYTIGPRMMMILKEAVADQELFLIRHINKVWKRGNRFGYRSIMGSCSVRGPIPFIKHACSWIAATQRHEIPLAVNGMPGLIHAGLGRWDSFGQDEQFLCRWLYYVAASRKTIATIDAGTPPDILHRDQMFYESMNGSHTYIQLPSRPVPVVKPGKGGVIWVFGPCPMTNADLAASIVKQLTVMQLPCLFIEEAMFRKGVCADQLPDKCAVNERVRRAAETARLSVHSNVWCVSDVGMPHTEHRRTTGHILKPRHLHLVFAGLERERAKPGNEKLYEPACVNGESSPEMLETLFEQPGNDCYRVAINRDIEAASRAIINHVFPPDKGVETPA